MVKPTMEMIHDLFGAKGKWIRAPRKRRGSTGFSLFLCHGLQMGFVISHRSLMDDLSSLTVFRIKYKEGHNAT
ncbi:unnamed protein product [Boreogadus saida]